MKVNENQTVEITKVMLYIYIIVKKYNINETITYFVFKYDYRLNLCFDE